MGTPGGFNLQSLMEGIDSAALVQQGQELQKRLKDPALQPSFGEQLIARYFPWGQAALQAKAEQRKQLQEFQSLMAQYAVKSGQPQLAQAFYAPLKPEEQQALIQQSQQRRSEQTKLLGDIGAVVNRSVGTNLPESFARAPEGAGPSNTAPFTQALQTRAPTGTETTQRYGALLRDPDFIARFGLVTGQNTTDILNTSQRQQELQLAPVKEQRAQLELQLKVLEEKRKQRALERFEQPFGPGTQLPTSVPSRVGETGGPLLETTASQQDQLLAAIRQTEASGPQAVSPAGAIGTYQIMPATGARYGASAEQLKDPRVNEMTARRHLTYLSQKFPGRPDLVLAAWHAGEGAVEKAGGAIPSTRDVNMTTADYVKRGMQFYEGGTGPAPQASGASAPSQTQQVTVDPFEPNKYIALGQTVTPEGGSINTGEVLQRGSGTYVMEQLQKGGYAALVPAMQQVFKHNTTPTTEQLKEIKKSATQLAFDEAKAKRAAQGIAEPQRTILAIQDAAQMTRGYFSAEGLDVLRDPVALARATAGAGVLGAAEGQQLLETNPITIQQSDTKDYNLYYNRKTGEPVPGNTPVNIVRQGESAGDFIKLRTPADAQDIEKVRRAAATLEPLLRLYEDIYGESGVFYQLEPSRRAVKGLEGWISTVLQTRPELAAAVREAEGRATGVAGLLGETGRKTDQDVQRALGILPQLAKFPTGPDSARVAHRLITDLVTAFDRELGVILHNPQFQDPYYIYRPYIPVPVSRPKR